MAAESTESEEPGLVGYIGLSIFLVIIASGLYAGYSRYLKSRPAVVSLSAYFLNSSGNPLTPKDLSSSHLKIKGEVHQAGQPLKDGSVRLTVSKQDHLLEQAVSVDIKNGQFETEDPAFRTLQPDDQVHIIAEVSSSQLSETATRELYLNAAPPALTRTGQIVLWGVISVPIIVFFVAFTGKKTPAKNRAAIIFSYCVIGLFLAVPLLAPVLLLHAFPNARRAMIGAPAGLMVTRVDNQPDSKSQWALNIGGYSTRVKRSPASSTSGNSQKPGEDSAVNTQTKASASEATANTSDKTSTTQPRNPSRVAPANPSPQSADKPGSIGVSGTGVTDGSLPPAKLEASTQAGSLDDVVDVQGGLVIPFYVIILSVIGGAINMTRKVPRFQREGEYSEVSFPPPVGKLETRVMSAFSSHKRVRGQSSNQSDSPSKTQKSVQNQDKAQAESTLVPSTPGRVAAAEGTAQSAANQAAAPADGETLPKIDAAVDTEKKTKEGGANAEETAAAEPSYDEQARDIDNQVDQLVKEQVQRNSDTDGTLAQIRGLLQQMQGIFDSRKGDDRILGFESFEDWLGNRVSLKELLGSNWRVELLNQYMYLISAPFLAIVAYYMLDLLGLTKQPILVLISFSVGLISERILSWLLSMATGYLRSDASTQSPAK